MALTIIQSPAQLPDDIKLTEEIDYDEYRGPLRSLLAAGLVRADQLPPPGKRAVGYSHGKVILRKCMRDETYLRITVCGDGNAVVLVGVSIETAKARRIAAMDARAKREIEREEMEKRREAMKDPGWVAAMSEMMMEPPSPARFKVGDLCMNVCGRYLEISGEYKLRKVLREDGRYLDESSGDAFDYAFGYTARQLGGKEYFCQAGDLLDAEGNVKHLQLAFKAN